MGKRHSSNSSKDKQLVDSVGTPLWESSATKVLSTSAGMIALALLIGFVIGFAVWAALEASAALTQLVWVSFRGQFDVWYFPIAICTLGGLAIGWNGAALPLPKTFNAS